MRHIDREHSTIDIVTGSDPMGVHGNFIQVSDTRYANSGLDFQGEGWVFDYDTVLGIGTNLIGLKVEEIAPQVIYQKCDEFAKCLDPIAILEELVKLKNLKDSFDTMVTKEMLQDYKQHKEAAWERARKYLSMKAEVDKVKKSFEEHNTPREERDVLSNGLSC